MFNRYNTGVTVELRNLVENGVNIWDFDYPSYYQGQAKLDFERKVIDHYYFRQIGQETVGRFLHYFRSRIRDIMPYYLQMYKSVELMESVEDPFEAYNLREEYTEETSGTGSASNTSQSEASSESSGSLTKNTGTTGNSTEKFSDTPQGEVANIDRYMTKVTVNDSEGSEDSSEESSGSASSTASGSGETTTEETGSKSYTLTRRGNIGVQPLGSEVNALRNSFINVDLMIIDELKDLFLQIY